MTEHETKIGSNETFIKMEENRMTFTVSGVELLAFNHTPNGAQIQTDYVTKQFVENRTINDLANQTADYNCQGFKFIGSGLTQAVDANNVLTTKSYVDTKSQNAQQLVNENHPINYLRALDNKLENGGCPLDMNNQKILGLATADQNNINEATNVQFVLNHVNSVVTTHGFSQIINGTNQNVKVVCTAANILLNADTNANHNKISNLADPTQDKDAVNRQYLEQQIQTASQIVSTLNNEIKLEASDTKIECSAVLDMKTNKIENIGQPQDTTDAARYDTVLNHYPSKIKNQGVELKCTSTEILNDSTVQFNMNGQKVVNIGNPTQALDAVNKTYLENYQFDSIAYNGGAQLNCTATQLVNQGQTLFNMNNEEIINVQDPTTLQSAATKNYVDTRTTNNTSAVDSLGGIQKDLYGPFSIRLSSNNTLISKFILGDGEYTYISEYDTADSDRLYLHGQSGINASHPISVTSDRDQKRDINDYIIDNPIQKIKQFQLKSYYMKEQDNQQKSLNQQDLQYGYIAQEVQEFFDIAVKQSETSAGISNSTLNPYYIQQLMLECIKVQQTTIEQLENRLTQVESIQ